MGLQQNVKLKIDGLAVLSITHKEIEFLDRLETTANRDKADNLDSYMIKVARLGGYLDRKNDPPPGATIMWRGTARLADLLEGFTIAQQGT